MSAAIEWMDVPYTQRFKYFGRVGKVRITGRTRRLIRGFDALVGLLEEHMEDHIVPSFYLYFVALRSPVRRGGSLVLKS